MIVTGSTAFAANWTLDATDIATGVNSTNINISGSPSVVVSVQSGRTIQPKTTPAGTQTHGTSGGVNGEIDVSPDFFDLDFNEDVFLSKIAIAWLFPDGNPGPAKGGVWELVGRSIFGDFDTLRLVGGDKDNIEGSRDSDFSFVNASGAVVVPVPAALPLMAAGLGLLGLVRSRR